MKKLLLVLILILGFQTLVKADDIRDFEIEGMSIGDSLLDYFAINEFTKKFPYKNKKWATISKAVSSFETYGGFQVHVKANDDKYIIGSIEGMILYKNNIDECYKKQQKIIHELDQMFENVKILEWHRPHEADPDSLAKTKNYELNSGDFIRVSCIDWSIQKGYVDKLKVSLASNEFIQWIEHEAYK